MRQVNLSEIRYDPQLVLLLEPAQHNYCPVCGFDMPPGCVICWRCGECLDPRIKKLAEAQP